MLMLNGLASSGISRIESHPVAVRYGNTFRLWAADEPVFFSSPPGSPTLASIGFWYTRDGVTECLVVMIRQARRSDDLIPHIDFIADELAERLSRKRRLANAYEFECSEMVLKAC